jgi:Ulp1 family protease
MRLSRGGSNDILLWQIINFYMELISDRSQKNQAKYPAIHCFNTFFCTTLLESGYAKLKRWTKRVDIFSKDMVLIPVNSSLHWTLAVFDFRKKRLAMYDSLGGNNARLVKVFICWLYIYYMVQRHTYTGHIQALLQYLEEEHMDKKKTPYDASTWSVYIPKVKFTHHGLRGSQSEADRLAGYSTSKKRRRLWSIRLYLCGEDIKG